MTLGFCCHRLKPALFWQSTNGLWQAGTPIPANDIWIAATAMQHGLRILTTDSHYLSIQQVIVDYVS